MKVAFFGGPLHGQTKEITYPDYVVALPPNLPEPLCEATSDTLPVIAPQQRRVTYTLEGRGPRGRVGVMILTYESVGVWLDWCQERVDMGKRPSTPEESRARTWVSRSLERAEPVTPERVGP